MPLCEAKFILITCIPIKIFCDLWWLLERTSQKNQPFSETEKVNKLNKKNAEKTNSSLFQRSVATFNTEGPQDEVEDFALRHSREPRESTDRRDNSPTERLSRQENNSAGGDQHSAMGKNECPVVKGEKNGPYCKEDTSRKEVEKKEGSAITNDTLNKCSNKKQYVDKIHGDQFCER